MSRYDGLIIPRSYSEYINKTDAATLQQALQLSGVLSGTVAAGDNKAVKSDAVNTALANYKKAYQFTYSNKRYVELCNFTSSETVHIKGVVGYSTTLNALEFDLIFTPTDIKGFYINKTGNASFGLYLYKRTDTEYVIYASGLDWSYIKFSSSKRITAFTNVTTTPPETLIKSLTTETQINSAVEKTLTEYKKTSITTLTNEDLNTIKDPGYYAMYNEDTVSNKPSGTNIKNNF